MIIDWEIRFSDIIKLILIFFSILAFIITTERWRQSVDDRLQSVESSRLNDKQDRKEIKDSLGYISTRLSRIEGKLNIDGADR